MRPVLIVPRKTRDLPSNPVSDSSPCDGCGACGAQCRWIKPKCGGGADAWPPRRQIIPELHHYSPENVTAGRAAPTASSQVVGRHTGPPPAYTIGAARQNLGHGCQPFAVERIQTRKTFCCQTVSKCSRPRT